MEGTRVTIRFPVMQIATVLIALAILAGTVIGAVWLTTRDLKSEVSDLRAETGDLGAAITSLAEAIKGMDERVDAVERDQNIVSEIQSRVLRALGYLDEPEIRKSLREPMK